MRQIDALLGGYASMAAALSDLVLAGLVPQGCRRQCALGSWRRQERAGIAILNPTQTPDTTATASAQIGLYTAAPTAAQAAALSGLA